MKAILYREHGGLEKLRYEDVPDPIPGPGEALVRVRACSVNHGLDVRVRESGEGWNMRPPRIPGADASGEVVAVGASVTSIQPGDRVAVDASIGCGTCAFCADDRSELCPNRKLIGVHRDGGYAEFVAVPEGNLLPLPDGLSYADAAASRVSFTTIWNLLVRRTQVAPTDTVAVVGAGGGLGTAAVQVARLFGARVIAVAGSQDKLDLARQLGADAGINYASGRFGDDVMRLTDDHGADVVVDTVGADTWQESIASLSAFGRLLTAGGASGHVVTMNLRDLHQKHGAILTASVGGRREFAEVAAHLAAGRLHAVIHDCLPLAEAATAQRLVHERRCLGKMVLQP